MICPCKKCSNKGCGVNHDSCEPYIAWRQYRNQQNEKSLAEYHYISRDREMRYRRNMKRRRSETMMDENLCIGCVYAKDKWHGSCFCTYYGVIIYKGKKKCWGREIKEEIDNESTNDHRQSDQRA